MFSTQHALSARQEKWLENCGNNSYKRIVNCQNVKTDIGKGDEGNIQIELIPKNGWEVEGNYKIIKHASKAIERLDNDSLPSTSAEFEVHLPEPKSVEYFRGIIKVKLDSTSLLDFEITTRSESLDSAALELAVVIGKKFGDNEALLSKVRNARDLTDVLRILMEEVQKLPDNQADVMNMISDIISGQCDDNRIRDLSITIQNLNTGEGSIVVKGNQQMLSQNEAPAELKDQEPVTKTLDNARLQHQHALRRVPQAPVNRPMIHHRNNFTTDRNQRRDSRRPNIAAGMSERRRHHQVNRPRCGL